MKTKFRLLIVVLVILAFPGPVFAQDQPRTEAFVYGTTFYDGLVYQSAMVPPNVETIYQLAGRQSVIAPRGTLIYYWPLTNRYEADWSVKNEIVEGKLEIYSGSQLYATLGLESYIVQYDDADPESTLSLSTGAQAEADWQKFKDKQAKYRDDLYNYYQSYQVYRDKVDALTARAAKEGTVPEAEWPVEPTQLAPMSLYSSEIARGFIVLLPAGEYRLQMRLPDGSIQPGGQKRLVVFDKIRDGVAFQIVPQSRWTQPEISTDPGGRIYSPPDTVLYLQPFSQSQFSEYLYNHLLDPQDLTPLTDRKKWVTFKALKAGVLITQRGDGTAVRIDPKSYVIQQNAGQGLGYEVKEFNPERDNRPSFEGYEINLDPANIDYAVSLVDKNNQDLAGSSRQIRVLYTDRSTALFVLSGMPLLVGLAMVFFRRRNIRNLKIKE